MRQILLFIAALMCGLAAATCGLSDELNGDLAVVLGLGFGGQAVFCAALAADGRWP